MRPPAAETVTESLLHHFDTPSKPPMVLLAQLLINYAMGSADQRASVYESNYFLHRVQDLLELGADTNMIWHEYQGDGQNNAHCCQSLVWIG